MSTNLWEVIDLKQTELIRHAALLTAIFLLSCLFLTAYAAPAAANTTNAPSSMESSDSAEAVTSATSTAVQEEPIRPIAQKLSFSTYQGVEVIGDLSGSDPQGGALSFELVAMPKKGTVTLDDEDPSLFIYTPDAGKAGKDTFTYIAKNEAGTASKEATVRIEIKKGKTGVRYEDMSGNASHAAAIQLAEAGVFTGRKVGNSYFFEPDSTVSRGEFLAMTMAAAGLGSVETANVTGFGDDANIPSWAKGYATEALGRGLITGKPENGRIVFSSDEPITYSEAAAILNRALSITDADVNAISEGNVPAWALQSVANLNSVGVPLASSDCTQKLDRARAAQMLCGTMELTQRTDDSGGIFGWLK